VLFFLQNVTDEDGQECNPLVAAARFGHHMIIKILLTKFKPDLEQEGVVKFDGYVIEGATALWCAACAGKTYNCTPKVFPSPSLTRNQMWRHNDVI